jgi:hypothetical protein
MTYSLDDLYGIAQGLYDSYSERNSLFARMDDLYYSRWTMPEGVPSWVLKVVSTDPHDAVQTTVRTFATLKPRFKVMPMLPNETNRDRANQIETAICYNFMQAGRRNDASVTWDVMLSASMYAEVAAQVIYLPYQEKVLEAMGKDTKRVKAAKRFGDFAFIIHNPANVYPEWSEYGLEGVLTVRVQTVDEFRATWGNLASKIVDEKEYQEGRVTYVTSFDYYTHEKRCVWGVMTDNSNPAISGHGIKILEEENQLGFIPYAIRRWGNSLSTLPEERVMPLLQSVYDSGQWDMLNVFDSLDATLTIKRAAQVQFAGEFPPGQSPQIDNTEPAGVMELPVGTRNFTPLQAQSVDQRVNMNKTDFKSRIWQSTVSRTLQTLEFPSGTAYSSVNQILSAATNSLSPYKMLGQMALSEIAHLMLCWGKYYDKEYGKGDTSLYGQYDDKSKAGRSISIPWDEIDPDKLEIESILTADMPVDKLQTINGAVMLKQNFSIPESDLIEDLGYGDPMELEKRRRLEDYKNAYVQVDLQKLQMQLQLEMQQAQMQMQMQAQQAQMQQQQEAAAQQQEAQMAGAANNASPANENLGGQGFNPAAGGEPPVTGARGQGGT